MCHSVSMPVIVEEEETHSKSPNPILKHEVHVNGNASKHSCPYGNHGNSIDTRGMFQFPEVNNHYSYDHLDKALNVLTKKALYILLCSYITIIMCM